MKRNYTKETLTILNNEINAYRVESDTNGNPRFVIHFLDLLTEDEQVRVVNETKSLREKYPNQWINSIDRLFDAALTKARKIGGVKYRAKWFGGGIVFQSYNLSEDLERLFKVGKIES